MYSTTAIRKVLLEDDTLEFHMWLWPWSPSSKIGNKIWGYKGTKCGDTGGGGRTVYDVGMPSLERWDLGFKSR
jgi:hypothetical protein